MSQLRRNDAPTAPRRGHRVVESRDRFARSAGSTSRRVPRHRHGHCSCPCPRTLPDGVPRHRVGPRTPSSIGVNNRNLPFPSVIAIRRSCTRRCTTGLVIGFRSTSQRASRHHHHHHRNDDDTHPRRPLPTAVDQYFTHAQIKFPLGRKLRVVKPDDRPGARGLCRDVVAETRLGPAVCVPVVVVVVV